MQFAALQARQAAVRLEQRSLPQRPQAAAPAVLQQPPERHRDDGRRPLAHRLPRQLPASRLALPR